jgi:hypothetical protein
MRRRFSLVVVLLGMLEVRTAGAQFAQPAAVRGLTAHQAVWPSPNDGTCLACVARGPGRHGASLDTAAWPAVTDDSTDKLSSGPAPPRFIIEYHRHPVAGAIVGAAVGVLIAYVHAANDANKCHNDRCQVIAVEPAITVPLFGLAGAVVGGFIGWMIRTE